MWLGVCLGAVAQDGSAKFGNASDQVGGGGGGGGGSSGGGGGATIKGGHQPPRQKPAAEQGIPFNVVLRYYDAKFKPSDVEEKVKKIPGVGAVYFRKDLQQLCVPMRAKLEDASKVKSAFPTECEYLSPVTVDWALKKDPQAKKSDASTLKDMLVSQNGVAKVVEGSGSRITLKADLSLFDPRTIDGICAEIGYTAALESHEYVTIQYESGYTYQNITDLCLETKGILLFWINHGAGEVTALVKKGDLKEEDAKKAFAKRTVQVKGVTRSARRK